MAKLIVLSDAVGQYVQVFGKRHVVRSGDTTIYIGGVSYELIGLADAIPTKVTAEKIVDERKVKRTRKPRKV